ncbi:MAG TPA: hypothetical protein VF832_15940 [Longimicrobiales bacterium]
MNQAEPLRRESPRQLELRLAEEIERLGGVLAAAVHLGGENDLRDVYIAAANGSAIPAIRDAAAETLRKAGLSVAPGTLRIGAVELGEPSLPTQPAEATETPPWRGRFLLLDGVDVQRSGSRAQCKVRLLRLEESIEGQAEDLDTDMGLARAAARATLNAAERASPSALGLEGVQIAEMFGRRYVVVSVEASAARRFVVLSGILALEGTRSLEESTALATLRAVERFISW